MKKAPFLTILSVFTILLISGCGGNSDKANDSQSDETTENAAPERDLKTTDGVIALLADMDIDVPDEFEPQSAELDGGYYKSKFKTAAIDSTTYESLKQWYIEMIEKKTNSGWKKVNIRDADEMFGSITYEDILYASNNDPIDGMTVSFTHMVSEEAALLTFSID